MINEKYSVSLSEISRVNKTFMCACCDNECDYDDYDGADWVGVRVYEQKNKYHYEVRFVDRTKRRSIGASAILRRSDATQAQLQENSWHEA